jgi:putative ABC transport system permease protein
MVTIIGGMIGVLDGLWIGVRPFTGYGIPLLFSIQSALLGVTVSFIVGLVSGIYPAWQASRLNPIDAMRNE